MQEILGMEVLQTPDECHQAIMQYAIANNKTQQFIDQVLKQATDFFKDAYSEGPQCNIQMPSCGFIDLEASRNSENHETQKQILYER